MRENSILDYLQMVLPMATEQDGSAVRVTRDSVLEAIKAYVESHSDHFTTQDIARHMGVEEYPVRAAISWLNRNEEIEIVPGVRSKRYLGEPENPDTRRHTTSYSASVYQIREKAGKVDFAALNRAFGFSM